MASSTTTSTIRLPRVLGRSASPIDRVFRSPPAVFGMGVIVLLVVTAATAPWLSPYPPLQIDLSNALTGPAPGHLLGTDQYGRDLLSRIIWGSRVSLLVGVAGVGLAMLAGSALGLASALSGGTFDLVLMRLMDILLSFPSLLIALLVVAILKPGLSVVVIAVAVSGIPSFGRLVRAEALAIREREYVLAARAAGAPGPRLAFRHVVPNVLGSVIVMTTALFAGAIITESNLSYLGLGVPQDVTSWGSMVKDGQSFLTSAPLLCVVPGFAITLTAAGISFFGDYLRDLLDPRLRREPLA